MTFVIGLNGPPGCGKDTVGKALVELFDRIHGVKPYRMAVAGPLRVMASQILGVDMTDDAVYAQAKETAFAHLGMETGRQVMIGLSEDYLKPRYGLEAIAAGRVRHVEGLAWRRPDGQRIVVITDVGFKIERVVFERAFKNSAWIQIHRPGTSFEGDSRQWVGGGPDDHTCIALTNEGTHMAQVHAIAGRIHDFVLNKLLWDLPLAEQLPLPT
jgi:hypothetical protein